MISDLVGTESVANFITCFRRCGYNRELLLSARDELDKSSSPSGCFQSELFVEVLKSAKILTSVSRGVYFVLVVVITNNNSKRIKCWFFRSIFLQLWECVLKEKNEIKAFI